MTEKKEDFFEEAEEYIEEDFDDNDYEDEPEEEDRPHPLITAGVFIGLVVFAAIICAILWNFTHKDSDDEASANATDAVQEVTMEEDGLNGEMSETGREESQASVHEAEASQAPEKESPLDATEASQAPESEIVEGTAGENESMSFIEVADTVTAKDVTNLRSTPSTSDSENIVAQLLNGETITRTGVNDATGWSRLDYNGQTVYAVSTYLTTDLAYVTPASPSDPNRITTMDDRVVVFEDCDDYVSPKEYVNLRLEPSTSQGNATINCQIRYGDIVHRTGYSEDSGWSRVEYNGLTLYVVSSMVYSVEATE